MGRATSATVYGYSAAIDLSRVNARRPRRAYGLRSAGAIDGHYPAYGARPRRSARPAVDPSTNLQGPTVAIDDDAPLMVRPRTDYATERKSAGVIRMGEW